jgi:hypothetical protein
VRTDIEAVIPRLKSKRTAGHSLGAALKSGRKIAGYAKPLGNEACYGHVEPVQAAHMIDRIVGPVIVDRQIGITAKNLYALVLVLWSNQRSKRDN